MLKMEREDEFNAFDLKLLGGEAKEFAVFSVEDNENIPSSVRSDLWGFINKGAVLSKSTDKDRKRFENRMAIARNLQLMMIPQNEITLKQLLEFQNVQQKNTIQTNRSMDGFERLALTTQIRELKSTKLPEPHKRGPIDMFKKALGMGPKKEELPAT